VNNTKTLNFRGQLFSLDRPKIMGILNLTDDSFFEGSRVSSGASLIEKVAKMIEEGVSILDLGAQSTRPGATLLSAEMELDRLLPALEEIRRHFPETPISIDTFYGSVARKVVEAGADMINDISAGSLDSEMIETIASLRGPYVLMHMKGTPQTMQHQAEYSNVTSEVILFLSKKVHELQLAGVSDIILDPGFGFGKNFEHNQQLFKSLAEVKKLGYPLLVGVSRKKMIQHISGTDANGSLNATTAAHILALQRGADILRVHDVKEAREAIEVFLHLG
jgi:dihydropteroate synthase